MWECWQGGGIGILLMPVSGVEALSIFVICDTRHIQIECVRRTREL
jgi:hypothetical protein